jgi:superoxide dismutase, Fe-Mn family
MEPRCMSGVHLCVSRTKEVVMITLPDLPYAYDALDPHVSAETMKTHHGKHHKKYVDTLNELVAGTDHENATVEQMILATNKATNAKDKKIFNNAAQHWNHSFLWNSFTPTENRDAAGAVLSAIDRDFGDFAAFKKAFVDEGVGHFGSGWVWLIIGDDGLEIMSTHDADLPLAHGKHSLLTCDLWEHAYYLDYKSDRKGFLETFVDTLANWKFAAANLAGASATRAEVAAE